MKASRNLVLSTFRGNDVDRINTFYSAQKLRQAAGRLHEDRPPVGEAGSDRKLRVPRVGRDVDVYLRRKRSGRARRQGLLPVGETVHRPWRLAPRGEEEAGKTFLHLEVWNFPELIDIKPDEGGTYIHAATEAFNEEGEREELVIRNWINHLGFSYHQIHASGHAPARSGRPRGKGRSRAGRSNPHGASGALPGVQEKEPVEAGGPEEGGPPPRGSMN